MAPARRTRFSKHLRRIALALVGLLGLAAVLTVSVDPALGDPARPTPRDIAAVREVWQQLKAARGAETETRVRVDDAAIAGIAALATDASGLGRFEAGIARGLLTGRASIALPAGLWVNLSASVTGEHAGFPEVRVKVGRVRLPLVAGRWAADLARQGLRMRGVTLPELDDMVRRVEVDREQVIADLVLPQDTGVVDELIAARAGPLDEAAVGAIYCRLAEQQRQAPVAGLSQLVRRAFDPARAGDEALNRAAFVALSLIVVGERAEALAPRAAEQARACAFPAAAFVLQQREDLAKHWTFSAGLTAVLGEDAAANLGEWKELDDSLPDGSGFSFVDLAADRSGMQAALRALDADSAARTAAELGRAEDEDLLPGALLHAPEGLSESSFVDRFGALDRARYERAVASIDRTLARQRAGRD